MLVRSKDVIAEIWKDVKGYEGLYQVSNLGCIRSLDRIIINSIGVKTKYRGKLLKQNISKFGYCRINLTHAQKREYFFVHRLIAQSFIPNPNNLPFVNHKDFNKINNHVNNLEWITGRDNIHHYYNTIESTSNYIGVHKLKTGCNKCGSGKWQVHISINNTPHRLNNHKSEKEAKKVYDTALEIYEKHGLDKFLEYKKSLYGKYNSSKYLGVSFSTQKQKWIAQVQRGYLTKAFETEIEALKAVITKYKEIGRPLHYTHEEYLKEKGAKC